MYATLTWADSSYHRLEGGEVPLAWFLGGSNPVSAGAQIFWEKSHTFAAKFSAGRRRLSAENPLMDTGLATRQSFY